MAYKRLGELLIAAGAITEADLQKALTIQKETKDRLGSVMINAGIITEQDLIEALQLQLGIEFVDLSKVSIPTELAQAVPKNIAKKYQVVPVRMVKDELFLAMIDPMNFFAMEEVRRVVRKKVVPMVATASGVEHAIMVLYGNEGAAKAIEEMRREAFANQDQFSSVLQQDASFVSNQLGDDVLSAPTIRLVNSVLERAVNERASDIHMEPREKEFHVRMRIDGIMRDILTVPRELQGSVISRVKIMAGMDIAERRVPQDGRFNIRVKDKSIDLRVSTLPTVYGEKVVARLLDKSGGNLTKQDIGLSGKNLEKFNELLHCQNGVLLLVGPTGSGKSTTMYAMLNELNTDEVNVVTLEDPVEYNVDRVNQVQINEKAGMTFAGGLRAILRQDPDIIAVGEIRDGETADIAMRAAITGHVVVSTIHTNDAMGTIDRLIDIGVEPYLIAGALKGVISQRLVRKICPNCKEAYAPTPEEAEDIGIQWQPELRLFHGKGCPECFNTGYRGRTAVFEIFSMNRNVRRQIGHVSSREILEQELAREDSGYISMRDDARRLVLEGVTTVSEVSRVIAVED